MKDRFSGHRAVMKNHLNVRYLANISVLVFAEIQITLLISLISYLDLEEMTIVYTFLV